MNTKRSSNSNRIKNFGLAACAIMALGVMTAGEAAAQCRTGGGNSGYGYNTGYGNYGNSDNTGAYSNRSGYGNNDYRNSQQPVAYRHGDHVDVEAGNGRRHLTGRGF